MIQHTRIVKPAYVITAIYIIFSSVYIVFSDRIVNNLFGHNSLEHIMRIQSTKGITFVFTSGLLIFFITDYFFKRLKKALKISNEYQLLSEQIISNSEDATCIFDCHGNVIMCNSSFHNLLDERELLEQRDMKINQLQNRYLRSFIEGFLTADNEKNERIFEYSSGQWLKISLSKIMILNEVQAILLRSQDVTEHILVEHALRQNELKYLSIFQKQPFGILLIDRKSDVKFHNDLFMKIMRLKYTQELQYFWKNTLREEEKDEFKVKWEKAKSTNTSFTSRLQISGSGGQRFWRELHITPLDVNYNRGFLITANDITEQVRIEEKIKRYSEELKQEVDRQTSELQERALKMEEYQNSLTELLHDVNKTKKELERANHQLMISNQELEAFAYSVSHDLQAPLRSIHGFSQAIREDYYDLLDESGRDHIDRISNSIIRMNELITDMLQLSRVSRAEFNRERINVSVLAQEIISELNGTLGVDKNINVSIQDDVICSGDRNLLNILLNNLIQNAIKFTSQNACPKIVIGQTSDGEIFVQDNGVGFDMKFADMIFEPFKRLHSARQFEGTGIGLTIVRRIVQRHSGQIRVQSEPNHGTTFYLQI